MSTPPDMADRHARVLARLTEMGLALAEQEFADAQAAETPAERIEAVKAFHVVSRGVRQCVALEARLARQQAQDTREVERTQAAAPSKKPSGVQVSRRIRDVREAVTRVIWHEAEDEIYAAWLEEQLNLELAGAIQHDSFCAEPLDAHIARLCRDMDLPEDAALNWRDLPDPDDPGDDDEDDGLDEPHTRSPDSATADPPSISSA